MSKSSLERKTEYLIIKLLNENQNTLLLQVSKVTILDKKLEPIYDPPRPGDIKHSLAEISKAKNKFGYSSKFSMQDGLKETIKWYQF